MGGWMKESTEGKLFFLLFLLKLTLPGPTKKRKISV